jgi:hypothetical protein
LIQLTLYWRSLSSDIPESYVAFVHLADETGVPVAQGDGVSAQGIRPTNSWREGEVIVDQHTFRLPSGAAPGIYSIWVGLFDPDTGPRLPLLVNGRQQFDDRLLLQTIEIEE